MQSTLTVNLPHIAGNLLAGSLAGCFIFFALTAAWYKRKVHRKKAGAAPGPAGDGPALITEIAENKLRYYIDYNILKMKCCFWFTLGGMLTGLAIVFLGMVLRYILPAAIQPCMIVSVAAFFVEFLGASFFVIHRLTVLEAQKSMLILQRASSPAAVKNMLPPGKELSGPALIELCRKILEMHSMG
jgi:hypothetical protein